MDLILEGNESAYGLIESRWFQSEGVEKDECKDLHCNLLIA